jgi:hypothetical protein
MAPLGGGTGPSAVPGVSGSPVGGGPPIPGLVPAPGSAQPAVPPIAQQLDALPNEQLEALLTDKEAFAAFVAKRISDTPVRAGGVDG